jgi:hypothetical protein
MFHQILDHRLPLQESNAMVDQCKYMIICKLLKVKGLPSFSSDGKDDRDALIIAIPRQRSFELSRNIGKTSKSSSPVLSAAKPWFSQGFSHFWPIALAFLHVHARACLHMLRRLVRCLAPW